MSRYGVNPPTSFFCIFSSTNGGTVRLIKIGLCRVQTFLKRLSHSQIARARDEVWVTPRHLHAAVSSRIPYLTLYLRLHSLSYHLPAAQSPTTISRATIIAVVTVLLCAIMPLVTIYTAVQRLIRRSASI